MAIDFENVQGFVLRGYNYPYSRHLLLRFPDGDAGRSFLAWAKGRVTHGATWPKGVKPEPLLNIGLTFEGLKAVGLADVLAAVNSNLVVDPSPTWPRRNPFPDEFVSAPSPRSLGDLLPPDDPANWWNGRFGTEAIHASLHLYTQSDAKLDAVVAEARREAASSGVVELVSNADGTPLGGKAVTGGKVHFGYVDGIAQPDVDWSAMPPIPPKVDLRNFLLGYATKELPSSPNQALTGELFRDCTYMAFRWMSQDVPGFEQYLDDNAHRVAPGRPREEGRELLAAKLVGRWRDGTPLVLSPDRPDPTLVNGEFMYAGDSDGTRCPFSSHIRASNPRDQELSEIARKEGVPRLLRRGSSYGPEWEPGLNDKDERGLIGIFLCASLDRQFLQILRWMNVNDFSPVFDGEVQGRQDPLFGSNSMKKSATFRIPVPGGSIEVPLPRPFVQSRGTAYFLVPSLSTLERFIHRP